MPARLFDWDRPWFSAVAEWGRAVERERNVPAALGEVAARLQLRNANGAPIRFAAPDAAGGAAYEEHIARSGEVPTRDNAHDFLNALVWLAFPRTKARLNELQAAAIARDGIGARRGPLRDAATLIDENAVLLVTERDDVVEALAAHDWHELFIAGRSAWRTDVRAVVFGHALMEKLMTPYPGVTAHALPVCLPAGAPLADVDASVAVALDTGLEPARLLPLPVLGIPGWAENEDPAYYQDRSVFRPARARRRAVAQAVEGRA